MNKATIESIEWHKDQLFKLLEDDDLIKIEGDIYSVKTELNEIIEKAKKRVWVKATSTRKGHYREMEVAEKEDIHGEPGEMTRSEKEKKVAGYFDSLSQEGERVAMAFDDHQGGLTDAYVEGKITWDDAIRPIANEVIRKDVIERKAAKKREKILQGYK